MSTRDPSSGGMGKRLMKAFLDNCRNKKIILFADNKDLDKLTKFYSRFGFRPCYLAMVRVK